MGIQTLAGGTAPVIGAMTGAAGAVLVGMVVGDVHNAAGNKMKKVNTMDKVDLCIETSPNT